MYREKERGLCTIPTGHAPEESRLFPFFFLRLFFSFLDSIFVSSLVILLSQVLVHFLLVVVELAHNYGYFFSILWEAFHDVIAFLNAALLTFFGS